MTKILLISYFLPPAGFVGGERTWAWARHLHKFGYYPVVVTRNWNAGQADLTDLVEDNIYHHEKNDSYEIHRLPYKAPLRDRVSRYPALRLLQKALTFGDLLLNNFWVNTIPYANMYAFAREYLSQEKDVRAVIVSGKPFQSFFFGYLLKKEFPHIRWIPDYRDEWSTHEKRIPANVLEKWVFALEKRSEKKWTSNADFFIGVSDACVQNISALTRQKGVTVPNGFDWPSAPTTVPDKHPQEPLTVSYLGTLYDFQEVELFIAAGKEISSKYQTALRVNFVGISMIPEQKKRVARLIEGYESVFCIVDRTHKARADQYMYESDVLLLMAYQNIHTWEPVKLFEYYSAQKPILLYPSDSGAMAAFLETTGSGHVAQTHDDCVQYLLALAKKKANGEDISVAFNPAAAYAYSRESRTQTLAAILDQT